MTKSQFTHEELYDQFVEYYGEPEEDDLKDMQIVEAAFSVVSSDGYPTDESGLVDYDAIATILQQVYTERTGRSDAPDELDPNQLQQLGEQWLEWMEAAGDTEDPQTAITMNERLEELEAQLPVDFVAGLAVALEWYLKQALEQAQMEEWYGEPPKAQVGGWSINDVIWSGQQDCDVDLTETQARAILQSVAHDMDASSGVNWGTIEFAIRDWLDKHPGEVAAYEEEEDA